MTLQEVVELFTEDKKDLRKRAKNIKKRSQVSSDNRLAKEVGGNRMTTENGVRGVEVMTPNVSVDRLCQIFANADSLNMEERKDGSLYLNLSDLGIKAGILLKDEIATVVNGTSRIVFSLQNLKKIFFPWEEVKKDNSSGIVLTLNSSVQQGNVKSNKILL